VKAIALAALALTAGPALATPELHSFRALEFKHDDLHRVAVARESFGHHIPVGTTVAAARATLEKAGARCVEGATLVCRHASTEAVENMHRSVHWTVDVTHRDGAVTGMAVDRESIGI
jgi:hypothetical protein